MELHTHQQSIPIAFVRRWLAPTITPIISDIILNSIS
jgi:hypothetical protein